MTVRPAKTQISLSICPVWLEALLCTEWVAKDPTSFLYADSEDWSDWVDAQADQSSLGTHAILLVLSWGGSYVICGSECLILKNGLNEPGREKRYTFYIGKQQRLKQACAIAQSCQSFCCLLTLSRERVWTLVLPHIFLRDWVMKQFLQPFSPYRWFKKGSCQLLPKIWAPDRLDVTWAVKPQNKVGN